MNSVLKLMNYVGQFVWRCFLATEHGAPPPRGDRFCIQIDGFCIQMMGLSIQMMVSMQTDRVGEC